MIWTNRDGELRLVEHGNAGVTYYMEVLFTDANLSGPVSRQRTEEILYANRGNIKSDKFGYNEGSNMVRLEPLPLTFTCRTADTDHSEALIKWLSGVTTVRGHRLYSRTGAGATSMIRIPQLNIGSAGLPSFKDGAKQTYEIQVLWSGSGVSNLGILWDEVYFPPHEQTVTEAEEGISLNINAQIYGGVTYITAFQGGTADLSTN